MKHYKCSSAKYLSHECACILFDTEEKDIYMVQEIQPQELYSFRTPSPDFSCAAAAFFSATSFSAAFLTSTAFFALDPGLRIFSRQKRLATSPPFCSVSIPIIAWRVSTATVL